MMGLTSRVSFEPLEDLRNSTPVSRDSSGAVSVADLDEREAYDEWRTQHPCLIKNFDQFEAAASGRLVSVFLDYDGTLTPIVSNPDAAFMSTQMRDAVQRVAQLFPTGIISGRGREKVQEFVALSELYYAGSHGMDIIGPQADGVCSDELAFQPAAQFAPLMNKVYDQLLDGLQGIAGSSVEHNKFCVSVHFRNCAPESYPAVCDVVDNIVNLHEGIRITRGRKVLELRPQVDWDKGTAIVHLLQMLGLKTEDVYCIYIGDDRTDEDAFKALSDNGLGDGILVSSRAKPTTSRWTLRDPDEVATFLSHLIAWGTGDMNRWHSVRSCVGWKITEFSDGDVECVTATSPRANYPRPTSPKGGNSCLPPLPPKTAVVNKQPTSTNAFVSATL